MHVRTFLELEESFITRLITAWKKDSDPIYAAIQKSCEEGKWGKARQLVTELDLSSVGEKQREWIKFMLLSFAMYGAHRVGGKPLLPGSSYDQTLNQVTSVFLQYLEHAATEQVQQQALQLIAQAEKEKTQKAEYSYGIVMVTIAPDSGAAQSLDEARSKISDNDLAGDGKDVGENHITVRYGIIGDTQKIREWVSQQPPFMVVLGKTHVFQPSESSDAAAPVVVDIYSHDLEKLHEGLASVGTWKESSFPNYHPHATLAYVKPEAAEKYKLLEVKGAQYWVTSLTVTGQDGSKEEVWLQELEKNNITIKEDRFVKPLVDFSNQGNDQLQLIAGLNGSRLATWGFTAEAELRGITTYKITPVLDSKLCEFCRLISKQTFSIPDARSKVLEALSAQNPEDLRTIQPWPSQDKKSIEEYRGYSTEDFVKEGLQIPPFHPGCRCVLTPEEDTPVIEKPEVENAAIPEQLTTADTFQEIGVDASDKDVDQWNRYLKISPVQALAELGQKSPSDILKNGGGNIQFQKNGDVSLGAKGIMDRLKYSIGTVFDPYTGKYYLSEADFIVGDPEAAKEFLRKLFPSLTNIGTSVGAKQLIVYVAAGEAASYVKMGFLPSQSQWNVIRQNALGEMRNGSLQEMADSLNPQDRKLVQDILQNNSPQSLTALVDLDLEFDGEPIGEYILEKVNGEFSLDLTDEDALDQLQESV